jgi:hypothetical protein
MCIDYTSLNKACSKDPFTLPRIDQIMDSTSIYDLLCFLNAYFYFHQIPMSRDDEEHTTFITVDDIFCYVSMPYGLKNVLPTFIRVMHKIFSDLIRDLIEVYIDDIAVKIKSCTSLLDNLAQVFDRLRSTHTKLNPDKCVFEVTAGKLLGFLVSYREIEANPKKIRTTEAMRSLVRIEDVQKLTGCLVALSWFISRLVERTLSFFKLLRKFEPFIWKGSGVVTCPTVSDSTSWHGRDPTSPRVQWHQARLPTREGSGVFMCTTAPDPPPDMGRLWRRHVPHGARPRLPVLEGSDVSTCHMALGVLWATSKMEILSRFTYSVGPTYI